jgi:predicted kinase
VVVLAGIPGAGKSTLLRRLFGDDDVRVLDSERLRNRWKPVLGAIPYSWWRPLLHVTHYIYVLRAIRAGGPLVIHECATRPLARRLIGYQARRSGLAVHLILLDVPGEVARAGQQARGRVVRARSMDVHCERWPQLVREASENPSSLIAGAVSAQVFNRYQADRLEKVTFSG